MSPQDFCYWLQGFSELQNESPTPEQWAIIREHLQLVFKKETSNKPTKHNDYELLVKIAQRDKDIDNFLKRNTPWEPSYPAVAPYTAPQPPIAPIITY